MVEKRINVSPGRILLLSYLLVIGVGTLLLALPQSRLVDIPFIDLLFTSAACTCITGLTTVPIAYFSDFGKIVMLCLIQLGGIGLLTLSLFFMSLFLNLGMATKMLAGEMFEFKWSRMRTFIITIVTTTFVFEIIGAIIFYPYFKKLLPTETAMFHAMFHSVSSFCNAGVSLLEEGILPFQNNTFFLLVTGFLVFMGSIGFVVWFEIGDRIKSYFGISHKLKKSFSLHTKIVLAATGSIIALGTTLTWVLERANTLKDVSFSQGIFASFFNTVSLRSAGFELFDVGQLMPATLLLFMILMYIGGSPGSIAGGIKTTTFALFVATIATIVRNRDEVELFGRRIPQDQIYRAISIIVLTVTWIFFTTFLLLITERQAGFNFIQVFFEVISSFSLCGLRTKTAASFSIFGKILIILTMLLGRLGSLTLIFALWKRKKKHLYRYPEEQVIIG